MITFKGLDKEARQVEFDVDGETVVRNVPDLFDGTIDEYISALGQGLAIEFAEVEKTEIEDPIMKAESILVE